MLGAVSRATSPERRSLTLGIAMGGAAFGQFIMLPGALAGIEILGWSGALVAMAIITVAILPLAVPLSERDGSVARTGAGEMSASSALRVALGHRGF